MLSEAATRVISSLTYQPDAQSEVNILPFGSVYWADELPDIRQLVPLSEQDRAEIIRMFSVRLEIWDEKALSDGDKELWDSIRTQVPEWPLFRRLKLTDEQQLARQNAKRQVAQEFEALSDDADGK